MSYPGNPSLAQDVQERISNTFQQTLALVTQGKGHEALTGCEFILRMDPLYRPAKILSQRLESGGPVSVDDLQRGEAAEPEAAGAALDDLGDLDDLDDLEDLGDLDDLDFGDEPPAAPPQPPPAAAAPAAPASGLGAVIQDLLEKRNFEQVLQIAETQKQTIERDPAVQSMVEAARGKLESETYVQAFLKSARQARDVGQAQEMESHLSKARALDPDHPDVLGFSVAPEPSPAAEQPLAFDQDEAPLVFGEEEPVSLAEPSDDLLALQQQSLSLEESAEDSVDFSAEQPPELTAEGGASADEEPFAEVTDEEPFGAEGAGESFAESPPAPADDEGEGRIAQLLQEGKEVFDQGEYQGAIDIWSRIFLIDIDNAEASRLIEAARNKKAELERQAEELFHEAVSQIESDSLDEAKGTLQQVLELEPSHSLAREYLEQLEAGQVPSVTPTAEVEIGADGLADDFETSEEKDTSQSMEAAVQRDRVVVVKKTDMRIIALGAVVALLVIGGGAFLFFKWDDLFPDQKKQPATTVRQVDPIVRATNVFDSGKVENAIILLDHIPPQHPSYEDAQALLAQWKAQVQAEEVTEPAETGPSEEQVVRRNLLLEAARDAGEERRFIRARRYFDRAGKILPLEVDNLALRAQCDRELAPLRDEIIKFEEGEYAQILPVLWRKRESDPDNLDIELLITDSYYNLALTDLQRGDAVSAARKLSEALEVQPDNRELQRLHLFAESYVREPQDLLYRIFVKYLPSR